MITVIDLKKLTEIDISANFTDILTQLPVMSFSTLAAACDKLNIDINNIYCGKYQGRLEKNKFIYENYYFCENEFVKGTKAKTNNINLLNNKENGKQY